MKYLCWLFFIPALVFPLLLLLLPPHPPLLLLPSWSSLHALGCVCVCVCVYLLLACPHAVPSCSGASWGEGKDFLFCHTSGPSLGSGASVCKLALSGATPPPTQLKFSPGCQVPLFFPPIFACITSHAGSSSLTRGQNCACTVLSCTGSAESSLLGHQGSPVVLPDPWCLGMVIPPHGWQFWVLQPSMVVHLTLPTLYIQSLWAAPHRTCLFFLGGPLTDIVIYVSN